MVDKPPANLTPIIYAHRLHEMQIIVRSCGYALALHGSMARDLDAIAVPWTKRAVTAETLVERLCEQMDLTIAGPPTAMPHGRLVWTLLLKSIGFVDLSTMPRTDALSTAPNKEAEGGDRADD